VADFAVRNPLPNPPPLAGEGTSRFLPRKRGRIEEGAIYFLPRKRGRIEDNVIKFSWSLWYKGLR